MYIKIIQLIKLYPVWFFSIVSGVFGLIFLLLIPPFQIPDELTHFTRSYEVSQFQSARVLKSGDVNRLGSMLPKSILKTYEITKTRLSPGSIDVEQAKKYKLGQTKDALHIALNPSEKTFYDTGASPNYFPVLYVPQAVIIKTLELINAPIIVMLYAVRLIGLAVWIGLVAFGIKLLKQPSRKAALASVLALPMFVAQGSASTDPLINGLATLFCVLVFNELVSKRVPSVKLILALLSIVSLMVLSKPVYIVFSLLFLLFINNFKDIKKSILWVSTAFVPFIVFILWSSIAKISGGPFYTDSVAISNADPSQQISYVIPNIFNFVQPFFNTFFLGWGDYIYVSFVGMFGKLDTPLPLIFVILGYILICVTIFARPDNDKITRMNDFILKKKTILITIFAMIVYILGVYLAMYIYSTPYHTKIVTGTQGRYFLPLLPLAVLFITKSTVSIKNKAYYSFITVTPVVLLFASTLIIYFRYYIFYP